MFTMLCLIRLEAAFENCIGLLSSLKNFECGIHISASYITGIMGVLWKSKQKKSFYLKGRNFREHWFSRIFFGHFAGINFRELGFNEDFAGINFRELSLTKDFAGINFRECALYKGFVGVNFAFSLKNIFSTTLVYGFESILSK